MKKRFFNLLALISISFLGYTQNVTVEITYIDNGKEILLDGNFNVYFFVMDSSLQQKLIKPAIINNTFTIEDHLENKMVYFLFKYKGMIIGFRENNFFLNNTSLIIGREKKFFSYENLDLQSNISKRDRFKGKIYIQNGWREMTIPLKKYNRYFKEQKRNFKRILKSF